mmetsp:Transcript_37254/g.57147  ORF Transcript_37254/g.57147 Transcript_37254/m.57147 type:complete len:117 (+) Transcript_37254:1151-1501(+)
MLDLLESRIKNRTKLPKNKGDSGDVIYAFNNEYKVRDLVSPLLDMVVTLSQNEYYIEYERNIPVFQQSSFRATFFRPDFEVVGRDGTTVCTIEVKKLFASHFNQRVKSFHSEKLDH